MAITASDCESASLDWHPVAGFRSRIFTQRADDAVIRVLLHDMGRPTGDSGHDKKGREEIDIESHQVVGGSCWKVQVGINILFLDHRLFQNIGNLGPLSLAREFS